MRYIVLVLLCFGNVDAGAQLSCVIQHLERNTLYLCRSNDLGIAVEGCEAKQIFVTTNNGNIVTDSGNISWNFKLWPDHTGPATVYIHKKKKEGSSHIIDSFHYTVRRINTGGAQTGSHAGGKVSCALIRTSITLGVPSPYEPLGWCDPGGKLNSFTVLIYRNNVEIFRSACGEQFNEETSRFFDRLIKGDKVVFTNICQKGCDGTDVRIPGFEIIAD